MCQFPAARAVMIGSGAMEAIMEKTLKFYGGVNLNSLENIVKCSLCKKKFNRTPEWGWWYRNNIVCSYHCMREMEKADPGSFYNMKKEARHLGMPDVPRNNAHMSDQESKEIYLAWKDGAGIEDLAAMFRRSRYGIKKALEGQGAVLPPAKAVRRVTTGECREMRRLRDQGLTYKEIGKRLSLNKSTVQRNLAAWADK